ncbi:hypothetical protein BDCR2A_01843 [Borrelia duttonii CR2A]|uniref:Uncharacterized protein n=1 Tax=Borrelia duttonii CR2A TaxID=1432657 RepID=W6TG10_9SPIR|nr:hypothetical protein BDCR2A_01843 [Borrelia duttonii CR2A]
MLNKNNFICYHLLVIIHPFIVIFILFFVSFLKGKLIKS